MSLLTLKCHNLHIFIFNETETPTVALRPRYHTNTNGGLFRSQEIV